MACIPYRLDGGNGTDRGGIELNSVFGPDSPGNAGSEPDRRLIAVGLCVIGVVLVAAMMADHFLVGAVVLAAPAIMLLLAGSPLRVLTIILSTQIILTLVQLNIARLYIGFINLRIDDLLSLWLILLWLISLPDRSMKGTRIGPQGYFIILFLAILTYSAAVGFRSGSLPLNIGFQLKPYGAYFLYFPILWVLWDDRSRRLIWKIILSSAVISGAIMMMKGFSGSGEGVYYRDETGLRISTRQPNAVGVIMLIWMGRLWQDWKKRPPLVLIIPSLLLMGGSILLSQTRGIWGGILLALAAAWILNLFRRRDGVPLARRMVVSITILAVFVILVVSAVSTIGIMSAASVTQRTGSESGNYLTDTSVLARLFAWQGIINELSGSHIFLGRGLGAEYTSYRFEFGRSISLFYVDGSFFQTALNMGIAGVFALLGIFVSSLIVAARLFLRTASRARAGIALGIFCGIILLLVASGFASVITNYRYTILWVLMLALLQVEIQKESKESVPDPEKTADQHLI